MAEPSPDEMEGGVVPAPAAPDAGDEATNESLPQPLGGEKEEERDEEASSQGAHDQLGVEKEEPASSEAPPPIPAPSPVYQESWSKLPRDVLVDKIKGIIYGQAIGDALGLATEFMSRQQAVGIYGPEGPNKYTDIVHDFHRMRWDQGDWTDDTDQMLLIVQMIVEGCGKVERCVFAKKMLQWMRNGFKELGDIGGMGIGMTVSQTLNHSSFLTRPHEAALAVWERSGRYLAANGAIMRTSILGALEFNRLERVIANTREVCLTTHADPRCLASCIAVTTAISLMLQGAYDARNPKEVLALTEAAMKEARVVLQLEDQKKEIAQHMTASSLKSLKLDDKHTIGYTFKALGAGFFGLRYSTDFRDTIRAVIIEAGDADSNASVCGALMGCKFGYSCLPSDLLTFPHRQWLDLQVDAFLSTIGLQSE